MICILAFGFMGMGQLNASDEISLEGIWMFRVGDRQEWATNAYDDSDWDRIKVPAKWENEGFQGYDGYAWYRIHVNIPERFKNRELILNLGYIDDADEVYINGVKIGRSGSFPPNFSTAFDAKRAYRLSGKNIRFDEENLIAVRVYDSKLAGGLISGKFSIKANENVPFLDIDLTGEWMFNKGRYIDEKRAKPILVPGLWENQGYYKYDGYAVYHKNVFISDELAAKQLILMAGKIDDVDQLYINEKLVGGTGTFYPYKGPTMYQELRNYIIPKKFIIPGKDNLIEIRVFDDHAGGGFVSGPVGIISQDKFRSYWKAKRKD